MNKPIRRPRKRWIINPKTRIHGRNTQNTSSRKREKEAIKRELESQ